MAAPRRPRDRRRCSSSLELLRRPLLHVAGLSFFVNLLLLVPALFMLQVFDRVLTSQSRETLLVLLLGVGVALALLLALDYLRARLQGVAGNIVAESLSPAVAKIIARAGRAAQRARQLRRACATSAALRNAVLRAGAAGAVRLAVGDRLCRGHLARPSAARHRRGARGGC